jgi:hypothetical protein
MNNSLSDEPELCFYAKKINNKEAKFKKSMGGFFISKKI